MNEWSVKVIHQNLSRDTHFVYREHTSNWLFFGKLWSLQTFSIYVAQNIYWTGVGKKSSFVENSYECITVFENHKMSEHCFLF
jgi:hypothetical protein